MAIVINGSGTVTGLAVGGLPDGTVDAGTLATNSVDSAELIDGAVDSSHLASGVGFNPDGAVVINESGADVDFRVESDTITHALHLDATNGQIANGSGSFKLGLQTTATNNYGWNIDISGASTISCGQNAAIKIGNFASSGMILINDTSVTGQTGLFVTGGGRMTLVSQTNAVYEASDSPNQNHIGVYQASGVIYIKNGMVSNVAASIITFRTRSAQ